MTDLLLHPVAIHHLPPFVTAPGETDVLFVVMASSCCWPSSASVSSTSNSTRCRSSWRIAVRRSSSSSSRCWDCWRSSPTTTPSGSPGCCWRWCRCPISRRRSARWPRSLERLAEACSPPRRHRHPSPPRTKPHLHRPPNPLRKPHRLPPISQPHRWSLEPCWNSSSARC